jgi:glycosyltransferase involved in cell wall biosynthesis
MDGGRTLGTESLSPGRAPAIEVPASPPPARVNVHVYQTPFTHESRILKATATLVRHRVFDAIAVIAAWRPGLPRTERLDASRKVLRLGSRFLPPGGGRLGQLVRAAEWQLAAFRAVLSLRPTCINCHNVWLLPLCVALKWCCRCHMVYDTHELETESTRSKGLRRLLSKLIERACISFADSIIVVGDLIAQWYRERYGLRQVFVVRNAPVIGDGPNGAPVRLKEQLGIPAGHLLFVYQGILDEPRSIRLMLDAFQSLPPDRHILFLGYGPLETLVRQCAARTPNVHFHPAVPPHEIRRYTAGADVGIHIPANQCLSYRFSLPNKFFEYLSVGIPVIVNDLPEMARIVNEHDAGWVLANPEEELLSTVRDLTRRAVDERRERLNEVRDQFGWARQEAPLLDAYRGLRDQSSRVEACAT